MEQVGYPLKSTVLFQPSTIDRFTAEALLTYTNSGRATMRSKLRSMAPSLLADKGRAPDFVMPIRPTSPLRPYSERKLATLLSWAAAQPSPERRTSARGLLSLGIGAGLAGREICSVVAGDVTISGDAISVRVRHGLARVVIVDKAWEVGLRERFDFVDGEGWMFRAGQAGGNPNLISDFVTRSSQRVHMQARRMRSTWLVNHLAKGTPLDVLLEAAGLQSGEALDRLLPFVPRRDADDRRRWLRGA
ncbi:hypothetical protein P9139_04185 [Curtobacterium flaccumfaciens]|nr:hypothetical protein P9139_04185 [Curtobacterium flaccumfaciens]